LGKWSPKRRTDAGWIDRPRNFRLARDAFLRRIVILEIAEHQRGLAGPNSAGRQIM
jgi:hypothetical protein